VPCRNFRHIDIRQACRSRVDSPHERARKTFGAQRLTGALLDRLTHHVNILEMSGEIYRLNQSRAKRRTQ